MESAIAALPPLHRKIVLAIAAEDSDEGMHVSAVWNKIGSPKDDVM